MIKTQFFQAMFSLQNNLKKNINEIKQRKQVERSKKINLKLTNYFYIIFQIYLNYFNDTNIK